MPQRVNKHKKPPVELPSSLSLEVVSLIRHGSGRPTKKRVIEKLDLEPPALPITFPNDNVLPAPGPPEDPSDRTDNVSEEPSSDPTSRSVSAKVEEWIPHRTAYLYELLRLEAPLYQDLPCLACNPTTEYECLCELAVEYHCLNCPSGELMCKGCLVSRHANSPLHKVQKWNGRFFEESTLTSVGLVTQLGHRIGDMCPNPSLLHNLMVFDLSGAHRLIVQYCYCDSSPPKNIQLLRFRWFPATIKRPSTAFAFDILDFFHKLQNQNKCNPYDFYHAIIQRTDAAGLNPEIHRYNEITLVLRLWTHLQQLKQGGAIHYSSTVELPPDGSMAIRCPACPQPGKNTVVFPEPESWKNTLFLGVDACFKLKLKDRGFKDTSLCTGLAYMVNEDPYQQHLDRNANVIDPMSTCGPDLHAVNQAHTKYIQGYAVTGVAAVSCRHAFVRPKGVVDLQKGERYMNVDYAVASTLGDEIKAGITDVVVTYDIACQWGKNLSKRLSNYSTVPSLNIKSLNSFRVAVPKFHIIGHRASCQASFNLAYMDGVGMTHGEGVETIWSHSTLLATWSRENGPNARHLVLDDHWGGWNWQKYLGLRTQLKTMLERACEWVKIQRETADAMTKAWPQSVPAWRKVLLAYKQNNSNPNPFKEPETGAVLAKLKNQLAREDLEKQRAGVTFPHKMSPAAFLQYALEVEATQRTFKAHNHDDSNEESTSFAERCRVLTKNVNSLHAPQCLYMPGIDSLNFIDPVLLANHPEKVEIKLPSGLPSASRDVMCVGGLPQLEYRLRFAQATNALHDICRLRRLTRIITMKSQSHITNSQKTGTRNCTVFDKTAAQLAQAVSTYHVAWTTIKTLAPNEEFGCWRNTLLELKNEDIRGPGREESEKSGSRFVQSWIWTTAPQTSISSRDPDLDAALRVEWCKAQERVKHYEEEVELVVEEMRRTLVTFEFNAGEWEQRATSPSLSALESTIATGAAAYAYKQADIQRQLVKIFVNDWHDILKKQPLATPWFKDYHRSRTDQRHRLVCNVKRYHSTPSRDIPAEFLRDDEMDSSNTESLLTD